MVDYSKWNKPIEISDDEDETHPNVDTASLNRWRHESRVIRMGESKQEWEEFDASKSDLARRTREMERRKASGKDVSESEKNLEALEQRLREREQELLKKDRLTPWNVDTIATDGFSKTVINVKEKPKDKEMTEEEKADQFIKFTQENEKLLQQFGMMRRYEDSKKFLMDHPHLACEDTANYLVYWCVDLSVEQKFGLMEHVSHQVIAMQFLLQLAKQLDVDPRACVSPFFSKIRNAEQTEYQDAFNQELSDFQKRIRKRAEEKIEKYLKEEREERLGPGGLDPVEVLESLPEELQKCFEARDIPMLQRAISKLPPDQASHYIQQCIDSGLWVPPASEPKTKEDDKDDGDQESAESVAPPIPQSVPPTETKESENKSDSNAISSAVQSTYNFISKLWGDFVSFLQMMIFGPRLIPQEPSRN